MGQLKTFSNGTAQDDCRADYVRKVAGGYECNAATIREDGALGIELVSGGSSIVISPGGIYIEAPNVYINSGRGPAMPRVAVPSVPNFFPGDVTEADSCQPGFDNRYDGGETILLRHRSSEQVLRRLPANWGR